MKVDIYSFVLNQFGNTQSHRNLEYIKHDRAYTEGPRHCNSDTDDLCKKLPSGTGYETVYSSVCPIGKDPKCQHTPYPVCTVNGNGTDLSAVYFDYGASSAYENIFVNAVPFNVTAAQGATPVSLVIGGLSCDTTYHFRVTADDENGRNAQGGDLAFTTTACPSPEAKPIPATSLWSLLAMSGLLAGAAAWVRSVRNR